MKDLESNIPKELVKGKRLAYLEGIRGMAAFMVVVHHFFLAFYPTTANGQSAVSHLGNFELWYYQSPFIFITNGQLYVYIFFVLSGYVLSKKFFIEKDINYLNSAFIRRLPRLYVPMAFSIIVAFVLLKLSWNFNGEASLFTKSFWFASLKGDPSLIKFIENIAFKAMFYRDNTYNTVLWSISVEFYGSLLLFASMALTAKVRNSIWIFVVIFSLLFINKNFEYCAFFLGYFINYFYKVKIDNVAYKRAVILILLVTGFFLGGFPHIYYKSTPTIKGSFYEFLNYAAVIKRGEFINEMGAFFLILAVLYSKRMQNFFSTRTLDFLGAVSFSIYLIHVLILQSFSSFVFIKLQPYFNYNVCFLIQFVFSILLILIISYVMTTMVDKKSLEISQYFYRKFFSKEKKLT